VGMSSANAVISYGKNAVVLAVAIGILTGK
jgi:hypothetical protein